MNTNHQATLLVLAAGIGSRYGGLKQADAFGPSGETILDYSIYDAMVSGFKRVLIVIRRDIEDDIKSIFLPRWQGKVELEFTFQDLDDLPGEYTPPRDRIKPWGTGHAIWAARNHIKGPFLVINADDFYGRSSYKLALDHLVNTAAGQEQSYCNVGYRLENTLSDFGYVSRAECFVNDQGYLDSIIERLRISKTGRGIVYQGNGGKEVVLKPDTTVSMNMWGFHASFFMQLEQKMFRFLEQEAGNIKSEYLLPMVVDELIKEDLIKVKVPISSEKWFGVTYKEDQENVREQLKRLTDGGTYPSPLGN
jgi:NDP-sugar pyrophosphorylase family protein